MIDIDLLPEESKPVERTPWPRLAAILSGVTLVTLALAVGGYLWFKKIPNLEQKKTELQETKRKKKKKVRVFEKLKSDIQKLQKIKRAIQEIQPADKKEKYRWSMSVDHLLQVIDRSPGIWIAGVSGELGSNQQQRRRGTSQKGKVKHSLKFRVHGAGKNLKPLLDFERRMKDYLIKEKKLFTNVKNLFKDYQRGSAEDRPFWYADLELQKREEKN